MLQHLHGRDHNRTDAQIPNTKVLQKSPFAPGVSQDGMNDKQSTAIFKHTPKAGITFCPKAANQVLFRKRGLMCVLEVVREVIY